MTTDRDPARCPICEQPNECGATRGESTCWCFTARIPEAVLTRVPAEDRGMRCVCAACAASGTTPEEPQLGR